MEYMDDIQLPASDQPCKECKRRRAKCDRCVPECSACVRSKRHCLYERHSRAPLTRKHLTQVEAKLERAEALLEKYRLALKSKPQTSTMQNVQLVSKDAGLSSIGLPSLVAWNNTEVENASKISNNGTSSGHNNGSKPTLAEPTGLCNDAQTLDCMDWDERHKPMSFGDARSWRQHVLDASSPAAVDESGGVLDGMAMLSVDGREVGYIGTTSGAAFLKYLWNSNDQSNNDGRSPSDRSKSQPSTLPSSPPPSRDFALPSDEGVRRVIADSFINAYFSLFHPCLPIVHEESFRAVQTGRQRPANKAEWSMLAHTMAAIGAFSAMTECLTVDTPFYYVAKASLSIDMLESGNITLVQALILMSYYLQKRNKLNSGYTFAGLAVRIAFGLGLHREFPNFKLSPLARETRRRVFWGSFVVDASICMTLSRPFSSARFSTDIELPSNIDDAALKEESPKSPPEATNITAFSALRAQAVFFLTADNIYKRLIKSPYPSLEELIALDKAHLETWYDNLPPVFRDTPTSELSGAFALARLITLCRQLHLRIIMYRPFLMPFLQKVASGQDSIGSGSTEAKGYDLCIQAAHNTIELTSHFWQTQTRTRMAAWYILYFTFQAALVPTICLRNALGFAGTESWRDDITTALDSVEDIQFIHASKCAAVIHELSDPYMYAAETAGGVNLDELREPDLLLEAQDFSMHFPTDGSFDFNAELPWPTVYQNPTDAELDMKLESEFTELLMPASANTAPSIQNDDFMASLNGMQDTPLNEME